MKHLFCCSLLLTLSISAFSQDQRIKAFVASTEFSTIYLNSSLSSHGSVDLTEATVKNYSVEGSVRTVPVIRIPIKNNGVLVGLVEGVRVKDQVGILPGNSKYIIGYRDYRAYNFNTKSGSIRQHDLNYNQVFTIQVSNGVITDTNPDPNPPSAYIVCDTDGNGNLGWGECYSCVTDACENSPNCNLMCDLLDITGSCTISLAAGCAVLSIMY